MKENYKDRLKHLRQVVDYDRCHSQSLPEFAFYADLLGKIDSHISEIKKLTKNLKEK